MSDDDQPFPFRLFHLKPPSPEEKVAQERQRFTMLDSVTPHLKQARESLLEAMTVTQDVRIRKALQRVSEVMDDLEIQQRKGPQL